MSCKERLCTTPVVIPFCILAGFFILWKYEWKPQGENIQSSGVSSQWPKLKRSGRNEQKIDIPARDGVWQNVDGWNFVYSAYYEERESWAHTIRIIGATQTDEREIFRCKLWYKNNTSVESRAKVHKFPRHHTFLYTACFIMCPLMAEEIPESVSVITVEKHVKNRLLVINTKEYVENHNRQTKGSSKTIGVCVKPLQDNYNDSVELVEFMELNQILGMDHVTVYKNSISLTTECILRNYMDEGRATLATAMPWKNDPEFQKEINDGNQLAALNDCLYRNMHNFSYLAFLDLDEFIVPALNNTVEELIETLERYFYEVLGRVGAYIFQNGFFYLELPDDVINETSRDAFARSLTTLRKTSRKLHLDPHGIRSKYIVKPKKVVEVEEARVSEFVQGFGSFPVFEGEGILHHYGVCEYGESRCTNETSRADRTAFRYKDQLVAAVKQRWQKLQKSCGLEDIQQATFDRPKPEKSFAKASSSSANIRKTRALTSKHDEGWRMEKQDFPEIPTKDNVWQPVGGASDKFYVYSAYCQENCSSIRIIGATKRLHPDPVLCKVRYPNKVTLTEVGTVQVLSEHKDLKYAAIFIQCPLAVANPTSVSIVTRKQMSPTNHLRVIDTQKYDNAGKFKRLGICVKPLHYVYNKTVQLVEFMELNRILGMDHVTFYNSSISPFTDCILRNYMDEGRATVLPWNDHFKSQREIKTENMMAALNDCLYRNMHNFTYLAFLDMDEFIMPAHNDTIQQLLETLNGRNRSLHIGSYNFRNGFFYLQWSNDPTTNSLHDVYEMNLTTLLKTRRMLKLHKHDKRSKYIVKPTTVVQVGNHAVYEFLKPYKRLKVSPLDGILNHYRICEFGGNDCVSHESLVDRTAWRYKGRLVGAVKRRWQELRKRCRIRGMHKPMDRSQQKSACKNKPAEISLQEKPAEISLQEKPLVNGASSFYLLSRYRYGLWFLPYTTLYY